MIAVHVTHEAVEKMGGIGAVIAGLVTTPDYQKAFPRTILVGPLLETNHPADERLGPGGTIMYSSLDMIDRDGWAPRFKPIEQSYEVGIVYGRRPVTDGNIHKPAEVEVLLVDVFRYNRDRLNLFKELLYSRFGIPSDRFESIWEFEQYVRLAEPACEALQVIGCQGTAREPVVMLAHEYMGVPTALKAMMSSTSVVRSAFYAHEVAPVRQIIENHPGHDLMFYNAMKEGERTGRVLEDYFPDVRNFFKHPVVKAARHCDAIFAVGDLVGREIRFLDAAYRTLPIDTVYNGVPAARQTLAHRQAHRAHMKQYARNLFGVEPDYIFTHVARPVLSKGIWRDLRVLHELEPLLEAQGKSGVFFMLGTLAGQRRTKDVLHMERVYGWPVHHDRGYPDLCNGEETLGEMFEAFNRHHQSIRVVLVNQFDWERRVCGLRMPEDMTLADIRRGTDVEFGMSVYEPYGISQLEPLCFGAICMPSNVCGCAGFVHSVAGELPPNILEANFAPEVDPLPPEGPLALGLEQREAIEAVECRRLAQELAARLPRTQSDFANLLKSGYELGDKLSWLAVVREYFLPAVREMCELDLLNGQ